MNRRRFMNNKNKLVFFQQRFFPAGTYNWTVPAGCTSVDVFLVGGGGGGRNAIGGGGGYTKTFKSDTTGWRDGGAISVTPGQVIPIIVGKGGQGTNHTTQSRQQAGYSQFLNSNYRAEGGWSGYWLSSNNVYSGGDGGSGGGVEYRNGNRPGSDGGDASASSGGKGQGHTTRDFGESTAIANAGGGSSTDVGNTTSGYAIGDGGNTTRNAPAGNETYYGGAGYGGGGAGFSYNGVSSSGTNTGGNGGDGTVLIRGYKYK